MSSWKPAPAPNTGKASAFTPLYHNGYAPPEPVEMRRASAGPSDNATNRYRAGLTFRSPDRRAYASSDEVTTTTTSPKDSYREASDMLASALEQIDGIIAGHSVDQLVDINSNPTPTPTTHFPTNVYPDWVRIPVTAALAQHTPTNSVQFAANGFGMPQGRAASESALYAETTFGSRLSNTYQPTPPVEVKSAAVPEDSNDETASPPVSDPHQSTPADAVPDLARKLAAALEQTAAAHGVFPPPPASVATRRLLFSWLHAPMPAHLQLTFVARRLTPSSGKTIHRSYSDSKYGKRTANGRAGDLYQYVMSPRGSWSTASRSPSPSTSTVSCPEYRELQDKLVRLEQDRESLCLQVSVLTEQVGAQTEKITEMETMLSDKGRKMNNTNEGIIQEEMANMQEKFMSLEQEKRSTEQKLAAAESEIKHLHCCLKERTAELRNGAYSPQSPLTATATVAQKVGGLSQATQDVRSSPSGMQHIHGASQTDEVEQLRATVQQLMAVNMDKEARISELGRAMEQQQNLMLQLKVLDGVETPGSCTSSIHRSKSSGSAHSFRIAPGVPPLVPNATGDINDQLKQLLSDDEHADPSSRLPTGARGIARDPLSVHSNLSSILSGNRSPLFSASGSTSVPGSHSYTSGLSTLTATGRGPSPLTIVNTSAPGTPRCRTARPALSTQGQQLAVELQQIASTFRRAPPATARPQRKPSTSSLRSSAGYQLPSSASLHSALAHTGDSVRGSVRSSGSRSTVAKSTRGGGFAWLKKMRPSKRSTSAPNLCPNGVIPSFDPLRIGQQPHHYRIPASHVGLGASTASESEEGSRSRERHLDRKSRRNRSLRNLLGLRRSSSQELLDDDPDLGDGSTFQRGRVRATAHPRLAWPSAETASLVNHVPVRPRLEVFGQWDGEQLADWLTELGLNMYSGECRRIIRSGRHLLSLSMGEYERELGIKNSLHRKKLMLSLRAIERDSTHDPALRMDYHQVLRWLDDIGLPQYRDSFAEARVDGSVLSALTVEDLLTLRVSSAMHHASIAKGIQILRSLDYNLTRLQRKYAKITTQCPDAVQLWTHHCVSEWLRSIDLAEFTPNLMCAGIHGGLMVLEPGFTAETLAAVLAIPQSKSLLRRHLTMHFNGIVGNSIVAVKRDYLANDPNAVMMGPALKVKIVRHGLLANRRKAGKGEVYAEAEDLLCPPNLAAAASTPTGSAGSDPATIVRNLAASNV